MAVIGVARFERLFRAAAALDVDKNDLKRHSDFVGQKIYDLLVIANAAAKANHRDIIEIADLPITKGLQESVHDFEELDEAINLMPILEDLTRQPPLDVSVHEEVEARLPAVVGGMTVALARTFKIIDPDLKNPQAEHWDRAFRIFGLLL